MSASCTGLAALFALKQLDLLCHGQICELASCTQLTSLKLAGKFHPGIWKSAFHQWHNPAVMAQAFQLPLQF